MKAILRFEIFTQSLFPELEDIRNMTAECGSVVSAEVGVVRGYDGGASGGQRVEGKED